MDLVFKQEYERCIFRIRIPKLELNQYTLNQIKNNKLYDLNLANEYKYLLNELNTKIIDKIKYCESKVSALLESRRNKKKD